jgi:chemotaxis protein MotB
MGKPDETIALDDELKPRRTVLPWFLLLGTLGFGGYLYWTVHRPLLEATQKKDTAIADLTKVVADAKRDAESAKATQSELAEAQDQMKQLQAALAKSTEQKGEDEKLLAQLKKDVSGAEVQGSAGQITVTMVDKILFKSGEATLTPEGENVLHKLGNVLAGTDKLIEVSGHADNQPVQGDRKLQFPTNWELSVTRATNVVRFLQEKVAIKPRRLKAAGYASYRPVASNAAPGGRAKNRRIEILLLPNNVKVVKGDFSEEKPNIADARPAPVARSRAK